MDPRTEFGTVPSKHHFPQLDGLRGLAVTLVVLFHYAGGATSRQPVLRLIGEANKLGWSGVTLFFVLSGFLITGILQDTRGHKHWWRNFYLRRVLRIFPLYYLSLLVAAIIGIWIYPTPLATHSVLVLAGYMQNVPGIALNTTTARWSSITIGVWRWKNSSIWSGRLFCNGCQAVGPPVGCASPSLLHHFASAACVFGCTGRTWVNFLQVRPEHWRPVAGWLWRCVAGKWHGSGLRGFRRQYFSFRCSVFWSSAGAAARLSLILR